MAKIIVDKSWLTIYQWAYPITAVVCLLLDIHTTTKNAFLLTNATWAPLSITIISNAKFLRTTHYRLFWVGILFLGAYIVLLFAGLTDMFEWPNAFFVGLYGLFLLLYPFVMKAVNVIHQKDMERLKMLKTKEEGGMLKLETPNGETRVLLHACCAPCSSAIIECMLANGIRPTVLYFNPNIYPLEEYERRKAENKRYVSALGLDFVDADYDHAHWLEQVKGLENEPERGGRCIKCFIIRMLYSAQYAAKNGFTLFATTLGSSRWKNLDDIAATGHAAAAKYPGITFWGENWRAGGLSERRREIVDGYGFYNQQYCGCEFSHKK